MAMAMMMEMGMMAGDGDDTLCVPLLLVVLCDGADVFVFWLQPRIVPSPSTVYTLAQLIMPNNGAISKEMGMLIEIWWW